MPKKIVVSIVILGLCSFLLGTIGAVVFYSQKCIALLKFDDKNHHSTPVLLQIGSLTSIILRTSQTNEKLLLSESLEEIESLERFKDSLLGEFKKTSEQFRKNKTLGDLNVDLDRLDSTLLKTMESFGKGQDKLQQFIELKKEKVKVNSKSKQKFEKFDNQRELLTHLLGKLAYENESSFDKLVTSSKAFQDEMDLNKLKSTIGNILNVNYPILFASFNLKSDASTLSSHIVGILNAKTQKDLAYFKNQYISQFSRIEFNLEEILYSNVTGKTAEVINQLSNTLIELNQLSQGSDGIFSLKEKNLQREKNILNFHAEIQKYTDAALSEINSVQLSLSY